MIDGFDARVLEAFDTAVWPLAIGIALLVGAAHAMRPGHGKTLVAAYLVAESARWAQAVALAVLVAGMHTVSVLALGLLWWWTAADRVGSIDTVTAWARLAVALAVLAVGVVVCRRRWRAFRHRRSGAGHHDHVHGPPPGARPDSASRSGWSWAGLAGIASAGALVPSPAAFMLLVSGLLTGRAALAVAMVTAFGIGLAATVLALGFIVITGRDWLGRKTKHRHTLRRFAAYAPLAGAAAIVCGAGFLSVNAVAALLPALSGHLST